SVPGSSPGRVTAVKKEFLREGFMKRRHFLRLTGSAISSLTILPLKLRAARGPAIITLEKARPSVPFGVQTGDVLADRAIIWSRTDRPARMLVEFSINEDFRNSWRRVGPTALQSS